MAFLDRISILMSGMRARLYVLMLGLAFQGCGLIVDVVQLVRPVAADEVQTLCARKKLQVGIAVEPFRPFVFPATFTDEGLRVTGMDVELIQEITSALSKHCGDQPITPVLNLVRYRDLFVLLNEVKLDLFVSSTSANVPAPGRSGLAYSIPYFYDGGIGGIVARPEVSDRVRAQLRGQSEQLDGPAVLRRVLAGLTVAVQEGTSAQFYAEANLTGIKLVLCDSLPAAFESQEPVIDVILGNQPVLQYLVTRVRKSWQQLTADGDRPLLLTREHYVVVMAEENYRLRWFVNGVLFRLDESGRLAEMRRRWVEETYAYPRRAASEGLPFAAENMARHYDQGTCRGRSRL